MAGAGSGPAPDFLCQLPRNIQLPSGAGCSQTQGGKRVPFWPTPSEPQAQGIVPSFPHRLFTPKASSPERPSSPFILQRSSLSHVEGRLQALYRAHPGQQLPGGEGLPSPPSPALPGTPHFSQSQPSWQSPPWPLPGTSASVSLDSLFFLQNPASQHGPFFHEVLQGCPRRGRRWPSPCLCLHPGSSHTWRLCSRAVPQGQRPALVEWSLPACLNFLDKPQMLRSGSQRSEVKG